MSPEVSFISSRIFYRKQLENSINRGACGSFFANNSNTVQIDSFQKIRVQAAKSFRVNKMKISLSGGINNLLNVRYFDNIRLNAFGGRFYEPAPGRNAYFGLILEFNF